VRLFVVAVTLEALGGPGRVPAGPLQGCSRRLDRHPVLLLGLAHVELRALEAHPVLPHLLVDRLHPEPGDHVALVDESTVRQNLDEHEPARVDLQVQFDLAGGRWDEGPRTGHRLTDRPLPGGHLAGSGLLRPSDGGEQSQDQYRARIHASGPLDSGKKRQSYPNSGRPSVGRNPAIHPGLKWYG